MRAYTYITYATTLPDLIKNVEEMTRIPVGSHNILAMTIKANGSELQAITTVWKTDDLYTDNVI